VFRLKLLRNIALIIFFKAIPVLGFVLLNLFLASEWDQQTYGDYSLMTGALFFIGPLLSFGMPELIARKVSVYSYQEKEDKIAKLYVQTITIVLLLTLIVVSIICFLSCGFICNDFIELLFISPVVALYFLSSAINRGRGFLIKSQAIESLFRMIIPIFVLILWFLFGANEYIVKLVFILTGLFVLVVVLIDAKKSIKSSLIKVYKRREYAAILSMGSPFFLISIMQGLKNFGDLFVVGYLLGSKYAAIYSITLQFAVVLSFAQMVISVLMSRELSWALKNKNISEINCWLVNYKRYSFFIGVFLYAMILVTGNILITSYLGLEYKEVILLFSILGVGRLAHLYVGPVMQLMALSNLQSEAAKTTVFVGGVNIILSFILVWSFGILGAAISGSISITLWAFILKSKVKVFLPELI